MLSHSSRSLDSAISASDEPIETNDENNFFVVNLDDYESASDDTAPTRTDIANATVAFKLCINQCVTTALTMTYHPPMSLPKSVVDGLFCANGKFSWQQTAKLVAAVGIGAAASTFSINPAFEAIPTLTQLITGDPTATFTGEPALMLIAEIVNPLRGGLLVSYSAVTMIDSFLTKSSAAVNYLKVEKPLPPDVERKPKSFLNNVWNKTQLGGRKSFDLACSVGANFPVLFSMWNINKGLGFTSFFANISIMWFGMDNLRLNPQSQYPARRVEMNYLNEQLNSFLLLPAARQNAILEKIKAAQTGDSRDQEKAVYTILLNLAKPEPGANDQLDLVKILRSHPTSWPKKIAINSVSVLSALSQVNFIENSGVSIAELFDDPYSATAIALGIVSAGFALLPNIGFGFKGGKRAAEQLFSDHPTLGQIVNPSLRDKLKYLVIFLNLFGGGTSATYTHLAASDFANVLKLQSEAQRILELSFITGAYVGSTTAVSQYLIDALDELLVFIAKRHSDEATQRLINFVTGFNQLVGTLEAMNIENYRDILANWKMRGVTDLSKTLHAIFSRELSDGEYAKLQSDLSKARDVANGAYKSGTVVLGARLQEGTYHVMNSFIGERQRPGLRRRNPQPDPEPGLEMQRRVSGPEMV